MMFNRYFFVRRRNLLKLCVLGLFFYIFYASSSGQNHQDLKEKKFRHDFGNDYHVENREVKRDVEAKQEDDKQVENPVLIENIKDDKYAELRKIIDKYDNSKKYHLIRDNGADAKGMNIDEKTLSSVEKEKYDEGWNKYAFNNYASNLIPFNRSVPDIRLEG